METLASSSVYPLPICCHSLHNQNASHRARKSAALAGVGFEGCVVGCVGLALPGAHFYALSRPNPWIELVEITGHLLELPVLIPPPNYTTPLGEMSIAKRLNFE